MGFLKKTQHFVREMRGDSARASLERDWMKKRVSPLPRKKEKEVKEVKKEEKKDASIFGGKPYIEKRDVNAWLQSSELFDRTDIGKDRRLALGKKLFGNTGYYLKPEEARGIKTQLELGKYGRFKDLPETDRKDAMRLVDQALKK